MDPSKLFEDITWADLIIGEHKLRPFESLTARCTSIKTFKQKQVKL